MKLLVGKKKAYLLYFTATVATVAISLPSPSSLHCSSSIPPHRCPHHPASQLTKVAHKGGRKSVAALRFFYSFLFGGGGGAGGGVNSLVYGSSKDDEEQKEA